MGCKANLDSAFKLFNPSRSPHQFISGSDIQHEESVEYPDDFGGRDVGGEQRCVARISSAVSGKEYCGIS
jgi:hypothetical protein